MKTLEKYDESFLIRKGKWLAGEGAGSWFVIETKGQLFSVKRFSQSGKCECSGLFQLNGAETFDPTDNFQISYPSHCNLITLLQFGKRIHLSRIDD
jgi:hypothetical protein